MGEFELIRRHFQHGLRPPGVALGNGDDCALLAPAPGQQLAVSTDMLVEGRHFLSTVDPEALGHKALAVNLSDLAAMGAEPVAFTLALALPRADDAWLAAFSRGLLALADVHRCALIGGDTTAGPLNLCLTVFGQVPLPVALRRDAAQADDDIYVSGQVGDARLALEVFRDRLAVPANAFARARRRMERPQPRLALGRALRGVARACADVSDGLLGDLTHILEASGVAARLCVDDLWAGALSADVQALDPAWAWTCALAGGDDYELVFTAPAAAREAVQHAARQADTPVTRIGQVVPMPAVPTRTWLIDGQGRPWRPPAEARLGSFDHFA